jgi:DNA repair exonuclease SbcCD ATPase subunit
MKKKGTVLIIFFATYSLSFSQGFTQEDRQLLKKLNENYIILNARIEALEKQIDIKFEGSNQRFEAVNTRLDSQDKRLDQQDKRLGDLWSLMLVLVAGILGSVAYMYWDRREANRPLKDKIELQEKELQMHKQEIDRLNVFVQQLLNKVAAL